MSTTKNRASKQPEAGEFPRKAVPCEEGKTDDETGRNCAKLATSSEIAAYRVIHASELNSSIGEILDIPTLLDELRNQGLAVSRGNMAQAEAMLMNQATALQSLFARLVERGMNAEYLQHFEPFMRMALRPQSQCRATVETLAAIKNPQPTAFVKQANIAHNQQVNNGLLAENTESRARKNKNPQNELLETNDGEWLDPGTTSETSNAYSAMATVGKVDRTKNRGR